MLAAGQPPLPACRAARCPASGPALHAGRGLLCGPTRGDEPRSHADAAAVWPACPAPQVKGILNKLTPEKFERLLGQLIPMVNSYEVLQASM